jgi:hypothetical protein
MMALLQRRAGISGLRHLLWVFFLLSHTMAIAQPIARSAEPVGTGTAQTPLREALSADGRLKAGQNGSFNAEGYTMRYDKNGAPVFSLSDDPLTGAFQWNGFGQRPLTATVDAIAVSGSDVYVGGAFTDAGGNLNADRIARWDGTTWNALGSGLNNTVFAIAVSGSDVYVGGNFTDAGGNLNADFVARWDGTTWNALGSGLNSTVFAIAVSGSDVYIGGQFDNAGGNLNADRIARWDGTTWNSLGSGVIGLVRAIVVSGSDVYVGGLFGDAGGNLNADNIARWDGSAWNNLGSGTNDRVSTIAISGNNIYVGGIFTSAGGIPNTVNVARWDGSWNALGTGLNGSVNSIVVSGSDVYVGGDFTDAGGNLNADRIARWDGTTWNALGSGVISLVRAIVVSGSDVYVGGLFGDAGGNLNADRIARWDGTTWNALGSGVNAAVRAIAVSGSDVYVGGDFTDPGGNPNADRIARWDGTTWNALGSGLNSTVFAIAVSGSDVYVGGNFTDAGGNLNADRIARWDGTTWNALSSGVNNNVFAIAASGSDAYVGGVFSQAGFVQTSFLAKWIGIYPDAAIAGQQRHVRQGAGLVSFLTENIPALRLSVSAGGNSTVNAFRYAQPSLNTGSLMPFQKPYRWIVQQLGIGSGLTAELRVNLPLLPQNQIADPTKAVLFQRASFGSGSFAALATTFDAATNELVAPVSTFGEFTIAELTPPDSVLLTAVTETGFTVAWTSAFPEYHVVYKANSPPTAVGDGTVILDGTGSTASATGLTPATPYFVAVFAKKNGDAVYSAAARLKAVSSQSATPEQSVLLAFAAGEVSEKVVGGTGLIIRMTTPSTTSGTMLITRQQSPAGNTGLPTTALTASGRSITADIVSSRWYSVSISGLSGFRYAADIDLTALSGVNNQRTLALLKRPDNASAWAGAANNHRSIGTTPSPNDSTISAPRAGHLLIEGLRGGGDFGFGANSIDNPLPTTLVAFSGFALSRGIRLNWRTASEVDNLGFVVLRNGVEIASYLQNRTLLGRGTSVEMTSYEFVDERAEKEIAYTYKLRSIDVSGFLHDYDRSVRLGLFDYSLSQNYPNPFNPATTIEFTLRNTGKVKLEVVDVLGRVVRRELLDGQAGKNRVAFNGAGLASGMYFYRVQAGGGVGEATFIATKKMMLIK